MLGDCTKNDIVLQIIDKIQSEQLPRNKEISTFSSEYNQGFEDALNKVKDLIHINSLKEDNQHEFIQNTFSSLYK